MITLRNIKKSFEQVDVLKGIDLDIKSGESVSVVGASGAGKSTLLHIIGTLEKSDSGELIIDNTTINSLNDKSLSAFRNASIGFVFQFHNLLSEFTAIENICIPAFIKGESINQAEKRANELLKLLNLKDRAHHKPNQLSGGEQQRIAVARALINQPNLLLADEPSGNLDSKNAEILHQTLIQINKESGQTCVIVTHNQQLAAMTDRKLTMTDGKLY